MVIRIKHRATVVNETTLFELMLRRRTSDTVIGQPEFEVTANKEGAMALFLMKKSPTRKGVLLSRKAPTNRANQVQEQ